MREDSREKEARKSYHQRRGWIVQVWRTLEGLFSPQNWVRFAIPIQIQLSVVLHRAATHGETGAADAGLMKSLPKTPLLLQKNSGVGTNR